MQQSTRTRRQTLRDRARTTRANARIHRRGNASLATYGIAQGLRPTDARSMVGTLRREIKKLGIDGTEERVHAGRRMRTTLRYTPAEVARAAANYRPRKAEYKAAAARLALAA